MLDMCTRAFEDLLYIFLPMWFSVTVIVLFLGPHCLLGISFQWYQASMDIDNDNSAPPKINLCGILNETLERTMQKIETLSIKRRETTAEQNQDLPL